MNATLFPDDGDGLKKEGMDRVLSNTPAKYKENFEAAVLALPKEARMTSETITCIIGQPPNHPNAVGAIIRGLACRGYIAKTGIRVKAQRPNQHSAMLEEWKRV